MIRRAAICAAAVAIGTVAMAQDTVPAMPAGAPIDPSAFDYARSITTGPAGFVSLPLDAAALAHSRGPRSRFADVRIVDASNRQIPYLLEPRDVPLEMAVPFARVEPGASELKSAPRTNTTIVSRKVFWGFLIVAVIALLALVARLATSPSSGDPSRPSAPRP